MDDPAAPGPSGSPANDNGNGNGNGNGGKGKPAVPKGREAFRNQRRESEVRNPEISASGKRRLR